MFYQTNQSQMDGICQTAHKAVEVEIDDDNQSIGKFLSLNGEEKQNGSQIVEENQEAVSNSNLVSSSEPAKNKVKRSPLHNFQKHFVTTLRRNVRIKWPEQDLPYLIIAKQIWQIFKSSKKYTKQFVYVILGQNSNQIDLEVLQKYALLKSYETYGEQVYLKAQAFLKEKILQTFRHTPTDKIMYERRIEKKKQFANYFYKILAQIQQGSMKKRLPKRRKLMKRNSSFKVSS